MSKHIWVVESSGGRKWRPAGNMWPLCDFSKKKAKATAMHNARMSPGLKWRAAKYARAS